MRHAEFLVVALLGCGSPCPIGHADPAREQAVREALAGLPGGKEALAAHPVRLCFTDHPSGEVLPDGTALLEADAEALPNAARLGHLLRHVAAPIGEPTGDCEAFVERAMGLEREAWAEEQRLRLHAGLGPRDDEAASLAVLEGAYSERCRTP